MWPGGGTTPPAGEPACGWEYERCQPLLTRKYTRENLIHALYETRINFAVRQWYRPDQLFDIPHIGFSTILLNKSVRTVALRTQI